VFFRVVVLTRRGSPRRVRAAAAVLGEGHHTASDGSNPYYLVNANGTVFFGAYEPATGWELWATDGTGAHLVADIFEGPYDSEISELTAVGARVFFQACEPTHGCELWKSVGVTASLVADLNPGPGSSRPEGACSFRAGWGTDSYAWRTTDSFDAQSLAVTRGSERTRTPMTAAVIGAPSIGPATRPTGVALEARCVAPALVADIARRTQDSIFRLTAVATRSSSWPANRRTAASCGRATARRRRGRDIGAARRTGGLLVHRRIAALLRRLRQRTRV
jgi:ELWxxDGT repeat protein